MDEVEAVIGFVTQGDTFVHQLIVILICVSSLIQWWLIHHFRIAENKWQRDFIGEQMKETRKNIGDLGQEIKPIGTEIRHLTDVINKWLSGQGKD